MEINVGETWVDASGVVMVLEDSLPHQKDDGYFFIGRVEGGRLYTEDGRRYGEEGDGPSRLVEKVEWSDVDLTQPIRLKSLPEKPIRYIGSNSAGSAVVEIEGSLFPATFDMRDIENIPIKKRSATGEMILVARGDGSVCVISAKDRLGECDTILANGCLTLTEGDGMPII